MICDHPKLKSNYTGKYACREPTCPEFANEVSK